MQVRVLFFGVLKDLTGRSVEVLTLPDRSTAADVVEHYERELPRLKGAFSSIAVSINQKYADRGEQLAAGDEVGLLPPVSGGSTSPDQGGTQVAIVRGPIATAEILQAIKQPPDGAALIFEGIVRNHTRGRRTLFLEYEAYETMALTEMRSLAAEALSRFSIRQLALVHRLGRIEIGETSVLIVVASAHRAAAFEACRWVIDTLKQTIPIWKKEHFSDGAVWADGEPFPERFRAGTDSPTAASK
ncbi:MAG: molybdenum cofactor biosynthesis protein MoaE [Acidobacteria bacterium]|nr:molybdenum cofactor biosynthesis protein MoaE [Acidobacteriota bacterium]